MSRSRRFTTCVDCGNHAIHGGRGLCLTCHSRHRRKGTLHRYPTGEPGNQYKTRGGAVSPRSTRRIRIEQAIALAGTVEGAHQHLARTGSAMPLETVQSVYDDMLEEVVVA